MTKLFYVLAFCALFFGLCVIAIGLWFPDKGMDGGLISLFSSLLFFVIGNLWSRVKDLEIEVKELKNAPKEDENS